MTSSPEPGSLVTKNNFHLGAQCSRSRMWCWGDQDHKKPMKLLRLLPAALGVTGSESDVWVEVEVQTGEQGASTTKRDKFRMGAQNAFDLVYGETPESQDTPIDPPNDLVGRPVTAANFIAGARVSRGPDWKWGEQDQGGPGILLRPSANSTT